MPYIKCLYGETASLRQPFDLFLQLFPSSGVAYLSNVQLLLRLLREVAPGIGIGRLAFSMALLRLLAFRICSLYIVVLMFRCFVLSDM